VNNADRYISFPLQFIHPDHPVPGDVFIYLDNRFIKYIKALNILSQLKQDQLIVKGVNFLFINRDNEERFLQWHDNIKRDEKRALLKELGNGHEKLINAHLAIKDDVLQFVTGEISLEIVQKIIIKTKHLVSKFKNNAGNKQYILRLLTYNNSVADHSMNVANLAVYFGLVNSISNKRNLYYLYMGGLLHDYGKTRINREYLKDPTSEQYIAAIQKHPSLGKGHLFFDGKIADEILDIIEQHHERHDGKGYPKGLKGDQIPELSKIVSIANLFDNLVTLDEGPIAERQIRAKETLQNDEGTYFDAKILEKCLRGLDLVTAKDIAS